MTVIIPGMNLSHDRVEVIPCDVSHFNWNYFKFQIKISSKMENFHNPWTFILYLVLCLAMLYEILIHRNHGDWPQALVS